MMIRNNPFFEIYATGGGFGFQLSYDHLRPIPYGQQGQVFYSGSADVTFYNQQTGENYYHSHSLSSEDDRTSTVSVEGTQSLYSARKYGVNIYIRDGSSEGEDFNDFYNLIYFHPSDGKINAYKGDDLTDIAFGSDYVDVFSGNGGDDFLDGENGNDRLSGGADSDRLIGREGNDTLDGGTGIDILAGGTGSDTYVVDTTRDKVIESAGSAYGTDTVKASVSYALTANVERLVLTGSANLSGTGNAAVNIITGNAGANVLAGGLSNDILTGGSGRDTIVFDTTIGTSNVDRITDFRSVDDTIRLENSIFKALTKAGTLASSAFKDITDGAALDSNDRILYNHDTGRLSYDADGSGAAKATTFAVLDTHPALTIQDFMVV